jgi:hypothetical protein
MRIRESPLLKAFDCPAGSLHVRRRSGQPLPETVCQRVEKIRRFGSVQTFDFDRSYHSLVRGFLGGR